MRLIDADALKKQIEDFHCKDCDNYNFVRCRACQIDDAISYLEEAPTISAERLAQATKQAEDWMSKAPYLCYDLAKELIAAVKEVTKYDATD